MKRWLLTTALLFAVGCERSHPAYCTLLDVSPPRCIVVDKDDQIVDDTFVQGFEVHHDGHRVFHYAGKYLCTQVAFAWGSTTPCEGVIPNETTR